MIDAKEREVLANGMKVLWIIWALMLGSLGFYIVVAHMIGDRIKMEELTPDVFSFLRTALYGISIVEFGIIPLIRKIILKSAKASQGPNQNIPGTGKHPAAARYASAMIVSLALSESIAIYGLVLYLLGKDLQSLYLLTALGAIAMLIYRPKMEELENLVMEPAGDRDDKRTI